MSQQLLKAFRKQTPLNKRYRRRMGKVDKQRVYVVWEVTNVQSEAECKRKDLLKQHTSTDR